MGRHKLTARYWSHPHPRDHFDNFIPNTERLVSIDPQTRARLADTFQDELMERYLLLQLTEKGRRFLSRSN